MALTAGVNVATTAGVNGEMISYCSQAAIAQLGERQTEDLKVPGSTPGLGIASFGSLSSVFPH